MDRTLILKSPNGTIETQIFTIDAPSSGNFTAALPSGVSSVKAGQKIATLSRAGEDKIMTAADGTTTRIPQTISTDITSPCECFISAQIAQNGQYKTEGAPLFELVPQKADITISALVPTTDVHRLKIGTIAAMTIAGTRTEIAGSVSDIKTSDKTITVEGQEGSIPASLVLLKPNSAISMDQVGRPVMVEFKL